MRCPLCEVSMKEVERRGVLIDVCPECRGVWLDRGELEKLLDSVALNEEAAPLERREGQTRAHWLPEEKQRAKRKRRGLLSEIFDFDFFD